MCEGGASDTVFNKNGAGKTRAFFPECSEPGIHVREGSEVRGRLKRLIGAYKMGWSGGLIMKKIGLGFLARSNCPGRRFRGRAASLGQRSQSFYFGRYGGRERRRQLGRRHGRRHRLRTFPPVDDGRDQRRHRGRPGRRGDGDRRPRRPRYGAQHPARSAPARSPAPARLELRPAEHDGRPGQDVRCRDFHRLPRPGFDAGRRPQTHHDD